MVSMLGRLRRSTRVVLIALIAGSFVLAAGRLNTYRLGLREIALQKACEAENLKARTAEKKQYTVRDIASAIIEADRAKDQEAVHKLAQAIIDLQTPRKLVDVELPDGTLLKGIPLGMTRAQIVEALKRSGVSVPDEWLDEKAQPGSVVPESDLPVTTSKSTVNSQKRLAIDWSAIETKETTIVCDADVLEQLQGNPIGIQSDIQKARAATRSSSTWPLPTAAIILGISLLYWGWYFFLRRIGELRAAVGGSPPRN
jgi:hypothetical protein